MSDSTNPPEDDSDFPPADLMAARRHRGAPRGNQNARTHGFYARSGSADRIPDSPIVDLIEEIEALRFWWKTLDRGTRLVTKKGVTFLGLRGIQMINRLIANLGNLARIQSGFYFEGPIETEAQRAEQPTSSEEPPTPA